MHALLLALAGLPVGFAVDRVVVHLAIPYLYDGEEEEDGTPEPAAARAANRPAGAETGSLVIDAAEPASDWLRRLIIVALTAGLFAGAGYRYSDPLHLAIVTAYICALMVSAATDLLVYRVPNAVTYPAIVGALAIAAVMPHGSVVSALAGAGVAGGALFLPALFTGGMGMGMGDVKLAIFAGLALGFAFTVPALLIMAFSGGAIASLLMIFGIRKRGEPIPYAPFIAIGALAALLWQGTVFVKLG
jgi:prepilin signal peptidase PulO-like enzyme (type II secretory pathway)